MLNRIYRRRFRRPDGLFNGHYLEVKSLYVLYHNSIFSMTFIGELDVTKAFSFIRERLASEIITIYQHTYFDHEEQAVFFNNSIFILRNKRMIELAGNYCQVLHTGQQYEWANSLIKELARFRIKQNETVIGFARQSTNN